MKKQWLQLLDRIDALSLRERVFLFISIIACVLALADVLWLSPAQTAYKQLTQRFATQSAELDRLRGELRTSTRPVDPAKVVREDIAAATARLDAVNADIKALVPLDKNGPALEQVLVQLLRRHDGLVLQGLSTTKAEAAPAASSAGNAVAVPTGLTKRGLELRVTGPYPELMRYVKTLETAMPALRWGALTLKSEKQPPELKLQVFVVGVQP
jgi:MSHA biogenesis protein MshJ